MDFLTLNFLNIKFLIAVESQINVGSITFHRNLLLQIPKLVKEWIFKNHLSLKEQIIAEKAVQIPMV